MPSDVNELNWFTLDIMTDGIELDTSLIELELDSRSQVCKKANIPTPI